MTEPAESAAAPVLISYVFPVYNEEDNFEYIRSQLNGFIDSFPFDYSLEFIFVDDGSSDNSWACLQRLAEELGCVTAVRLSRNFGHQYALTAGYEHCSGEAIICMDADLQDPFSTTLDMIRHWKEGADIVYGVRKSRDGETSFKLWTADLFYKFYEKLSSVKVPRNCGDFRLMSRRALKAFLSLRERHRYLRGLVGWVGYKAEVIEYERQARLHGETKYTLFKMIRLATDALIGMSMLPLRLSYLAALMVLGLSSAYLFAALVQYFFLGYEIVPGWTSLIFLIMLFGFFNLFSIGLLGEYVGRIYEEVKQRPLYLVSDVISGTPRKPDSIDKPE